MATLLDRFTEQELVEIIESDIDGKIKIAQLQALCSTTMEYVCYKCKELHCFGNTDICTLEQKCRDLGVEVK